MPFSDTSQLQRIISAKVSKFCLVGLSGTVVDMGVFWLLSKTIPVLPISGVKLVSGSVAMLNNFYWNDLWTFREASNEEFKFKNPKSRLISFVIICGIGLLLGIIMVEGLSGPMGINMYVSNFCAILAATVWNYIMNCLISWGRRL